MGRKRESPGTRSYYETLQKIFRLQSEVLTGVLPHPGERGRNDEERVREFLRKVLPRKFSVGTGFLVCSERSVPPSSQTDVVIFDEVHNSPLHSELAAFVYPVEMVYGIVEVKGLLKPSNLTKCVADIAKVRKLSKSKHYVQYGVQPVSQDNPGQLVVAAFELTDHLAPRSFVFAYDITGWESPEAFALSWKNALTANRDGHIHGVVVLSKDWFLYQVAHSGTEVQLKHFSGDALLRFVSCLIHTLASFPMRQMSIDRYLNLED